MLRPLLTPAGFAIDSFVPSPGWQRRRQGARVTWSGGPVRSGDDAAFQFLADPGEAKSYAFTVRQTYSDGSVVDWSGPEAPTVEARDSLGGGGGTLTVVAIVLGALGLLLGGAALVRRLVLAEAALVAGAVFAAAVLTSLAPPADAVAATGAAHVGPGAVDRTVAQDGYRVGVRVTPNQPALPNRVALTITRAGRPVTGAGVTSSFTMLDMEMGRQSYRLPETAPGVYASTSPGLVMVGRWGLGFDVEPRTGAPFSVSVVDQAGR